MKRKLSEEEAEKIAEDREWEKTAPVEQPVRDLPGGKHWPMTSDGPVRV